MVTAITMTYVPEAIGVTRAAEPAGMPVVDLVHGRDRRPAADRRQSLPEAIERVDVATIAGIPPTT